MCCQLPKQKLSREWGGEVLLGTEGAIESTREIRQTRSTIPMGHFKIWAVGLNPWGRIQCPWVLKQGELFLGTGETDAQFFLVFEVA